MQYENYFMIIMIIKYVKRILSILGIRINARCYVIYIFDSKMTLISLLIGIINFKIECKKDESIQKSQKFYK